MCGKYKSVYAGALSLLLETMFVSQFMIVVDQDECALQFAENLRELAKNLSGSILTHSLDKSRELLSDISKMLYLATVNSVRTIVLLCSDYLAELVFRRARLSALEHSNILWIAVEFSSGSGNMAAPSLLLSLSLEGAVDETLPVLDASATNLLDMKAIVSQCVKEGTVTKS